MGKSLLSQGFAAASLAFLAGCTSISTNYSGEITKPSTTRLYACSGYNCVYQTKVDLGATDTARFTEIMTPGAASPEAERASISTAVQYFEERTMQLTGVKDEPQSVLGDSGKKGQMDCIDESTNTRTLLLYLSNAGLLKHHKVERNVSRGLLVDGRYPHATAVVRDPAGKKWVVDSWYAPQAEAPDIMPLSEWLPRGFLSSGEVKKDAKKAEPPAPTAPAA